MREIVTFEAPDTIMLTLKGKLTPEMGEEMFKQWARIKDLGEEVKVLVDQSELTEIPPKTREVLRKGGSKLKISRMAIYGASTKIRIMAGLIIKMVPQVGKSVFVKTEEEARAWLEDK